VIRATSITTSASKRATATPQARGFPATARRCRPRRCAWWPALGWAAFTGSRALGQEGCDPHRSVVDRGTRAIAGGKATLVSDEGPRYW